MVSPVCAAVGVKEVIVAAGKRVKPPIVATPREVVMLIESVGPVPGFATPAMMVEESMIVNEYAGAPPSVTDVAPLKYHPWMVIRSPAVPEPGEK